MSESMAQPILRKGILSAMPKARARPRRAGQVSQEGRSASGLNEEKICVRGQCLREKCKF